MLLQIHPENPEGRKIKQAVEILKKGGVIIYPSDSVYALGCDIKQAKAIEKICKIRGWKPQKANLSFICKDISEVSEYTPPIDNQTFKLLKRNAPGPFTFILKAGNKVVKLLKNKRKTIGIRIPSHNIIEAIIAELGNPILSTSLKADDEILEYFTDAEDIHDDFKNQVDLVIDGGVGNNVPSTVVDCTEFPPVIIREGAGELVY